MNLGRFIVNTHDTERRRFTRISFDAKTELNVEGNIYDVDLVDVSFNGVLVKSDKPLTFNIGQEAEVTIHLLGDDIAIRTPATLAHKREQEYGFLIENLDIDSLTWYNLHTLQTLFGYIPFRHYSAFKTMLCGLSDSLLTIWHWTNFTRQSDFTKHH